jgi:capsular exopolysaccharide synthesis family protein
MATSESNIPEETLRLREYVGVLLRRKWSIIAITLLCVAAALFYARQQTPIYSSTAEVQATITLALNPGQLTSVAGPNMDTEVKIVTSDQRVIKCASLIMADPAFRVDPSAPLALDLTKACSFQALAAIPVPKDLDRHVSVTFPQQSSILEITYADPSKTTTQAGAQAFALAYVQIRTQAAEEQLTNLRKPVLAEEKTLLSDAKALRTEIDDLLVQLASESVSPNLEQVLRDKEDQLNLINQQLLGLSTILLNLDNSKINPPQLVLPARLPIAPISPNKILDGILGLLIGLTFGIGLAILRERLDDGLRDRSDLEGAVGAPVLAVIPHVPGWKKRQDTKLVSLEQPKSAVSEAYRTLRTSVLFTGMQRGVKALMVVSPTAGEGKTTTAANLAVSLADANKRVILISADLRKPRVHRFFGLENEVGLSSVLTGDAKAWEALQDPKIDNLRVMASGPVPARPGELLQSEAMGELIAELREVADFVIVDTAPILLVADALALSPLVEGVIFVADSEVTTRGAVAHAREQLEQVGAPIIGAVFNNFNPSKARNYSPYGYYPYRYRYGRYGYGERYGYGYGYYGTPTAPAANGGRAEREPRSLEDIPPRDRP